MTPHVHSQHTHTHITSCLCSVPLTFRSRSQVSCSSQRLLRYCELHRDLDTHPFTSLAARLATGLTCLGCGLPHSLPVDDLWDGLAVGMALFGRKRRRAYPHGDETAWTCPTTAVAADEGAQHRREQESAAASCPPLCCAEWGCGAVLHGHRPGSLGSALEAAREHEYIRKVLGELQACREAAERLRRGDARRPSGARGTGTEDGTIGVECVEEIFRHERACPREHGKLFTRVESTPVDATGTAAHGSTSPSAIRGVSDLRAFGKCPPPVRETNGTVHSESEATHRAGSGAGGDDGLSVSFAAEPCKAQPFLGGATTPTQHAAPSRLGCRTAAGLPPPKCGAAKRRHAHVLDSPLCAKGGKLSLSQREQGSTGTGTEPEAPSADARKGGCASSCVSRHGETLRDVFDAEEDKSSLSVGHAAQRSNAARDEGTTPQGSAPRRSTETPHPGVRKSRSNGGVLLADVPRRGGSGLFLSPRERAAQHVARKSSELFFSPYDVSGRRGRARVPSPSPVPSARGTLPSTAEQPALVSARLSFASAASGRRSSVGLADWTHPTADGTPAAAQDSTVQASSPPAPAPAHTTPRHEARHEPLGAPCSARPARRQDGTCEDVYEKEVGLLFALGLANFGTGVPHQVCRCCVTVWCIFAVCQKGAIPA